MRRRARATVAAVVCLAAGMASTPLHAARIAEVSAMGIGERAARFFFLGDPSLRYALAGSVFLGLACGLMGSFLVVRRLALMSDALSHAILPGIALGYLWSMTKNPLAIFIGATLAGLLAAATAHAIVTTTRQKEDAALGFVLAAFFALGVCLLTRIQSLPGGGKSGLNSFLFGQAAALGRGDVLLLGIVAGAAILILGVFYKEFLTASFDPGFARATGMRVAFFQGLLMLLLALAIVAALQAVGVVLVSAMLVIPAASALLLTDRFHWMLILSCVFGMAGGLAGAFFSYMGGGLPTGPMMVVSAAAIFVTALLGAPRHGILARAWQRTRRDRRIRRENTLKAIYRILENRGFQGGTVSLTELTAERGDAGGESPERMARPLRELERHGLATRGEGTAEFALTPAGWQRACEIVRNHRLWELYLSHAAQIPADHVHDEAEEIEHVLGEETVRRLERRLNYARRDPHGKLIPGLEDIHGGPLPATPERATGFGRPPA